MTDDCGNLLRLRITDFYPRTVDDGWVIAAGKVAENWLSRSKVIKQFVEADTVIKQIGKRIMGKVQVCTADDGGNVFLLHPALEHHIGDVFIADPPLQRFTLVAVAPDQKLDAGIFHTLRRIQQQTEVVDPTDGAGIDDLKNIRIVQVGNRD